jgi:radical SAM superfamily enzyme YgiQ (UPF0313 family)
MKILLIESGVTALERFVYACYPPHGLMYIASWVRRNRPQHELVLFDMMAERARPDAVDAVLKSFSPDLVAIHAMTFQASCMHALAARVKAWDPQCTVAVGGPHASAAPELVVADDNIDVAGVGEGEVTFLELVDRIEAGEDLAGTAGAVVKRDGKTVLGPEREFISDLDAIPFPAWDMIDPSRYFTDVMLNQNDITCRRQVAPIFSSRACPFGCTFCHHIFGKKFRARSVENVLAEMEELSHRYGIREFHLIDDCFNLRIKQAIGFFTAVLDRGLDLKFAFPNGVRADRLPDELLDVMKKAGVYKINLGVESGSPRVQKMVKKNLSLDAVRDGISRTAARRIFTHGFFMLGFPDETEAEMCETIDFACSSDLHTAGFAILSPFPGTEVYRVARETGKEVKFDPDDTSYQRITSNLSAVDDRTLLRIHKLAHRKFYGSPRRLYRILTTMPHPSDMVKVGIKHFRLKFL